MKMNHYLNVPGLLRRFAKIGLALLLVLSVAFGAGAQDVSPARVSGTVVDQQGMPVVGAGVVVRGTQTGSVTDLDGRFTVMAAKDATLTVILPRRCALRPTCPSIRSRATPPIRPSCSITAANTMPNPTRRPAGAKTARSMSRPASTSAAISASTPSRPWRSSPANATPRPG